MLCRWYLWYSEITLPGQFFLHHATSDAAKVNESNNKRRDKVARFLPLLTEARGFLGNVPIAYEGSTSLYRSRYDQSVCLVLEFVCRRNFSNSDSPNRLRRRGQFSNTDASLFRHGDCVYQ